MKYDFIIDLFFKDISLSLLFLFGLIVGFVFKDILAELAGKKNELVNSYVVFLILPFIAILSFVFIRFFFFLQIPSIEDFSSINNFTNSYLFWIAVGTLVSGAARFAFDSLKK